MPKYSRTFFSLDLSFNGDSASFLIRNIRPRIILLNIMGPSKSIKRACHHPFQQIMLWVVNNLLSGNASYTYFILSEYLKIKLE